MKLILMDFMQDKTQLICISSKQVNAQIILQAKEQCSQLFSKYPAEIFKFKDILIS